MTIDEERDLGFGAVVARESRKRLLNRDGSFNVARQGSGALRALSVYHTALTVSWPRFLGMLTAAYVVSNALFALAYLLCGPGALHTPSTGAPEGTFLQAFYFSVETFGTIGYGNIYPVGIPANTVMTVEALVGLLAFALSTGIIFARFARPTARIRFSRFAVVAPYRETSAFEFRIVNERRSQIVELEAKVQLTRFEHVDGAATRQFYDLVLERRRVAFFPLAWTIVHPIDASSPLFGVTRDDLIASGAEFLVLLTGIDEAFSQMVHTRSSYRADELLWDARFQSVFTPTAADGVLRIDVRRLDEVERMASADDDANVAERSA